jgi:hypothetical protein
MNASVKHIAFRATNLTVHAIGYGLDDRVVGVLVLVGSKNFLFSTSSRPALGSTQPPIHLAPGVKRPGRETGHSLPIPLRGVVLN